MYEDRKAADQPGRVHAPVPGAEQARAMAFLAENVFATPNWLLDPEILRRMDAGGEIERIHSVQSRILRRLLDPERMQRLIETEAEQGAGAYTLTRLFDDVRSTIWSEPSDPYRRALQRAHLDRLEWLMTDEEVAGSDAPALARLDLTRISGLARDNMAGSSDPLVAAHFNDVVERIAAFVEGRRIER